MLLVFEGINRGMCVAVQVALYPYVWYVFLCMLGATELGAKSSFSAYVLNGWPLILLVIYQEMADKRSMAGHGWQFDMFPLPKSKGKQLERRKATHYSVLLYLNHVE